MKNKRRVPRSLPDSVVNAIREWENAKGVSVLSNAPATKAIAELFWSGCDPITILDLLSKFAGVGLSVKSVQKEMKRVLGRVHQLSRRLQEDAKEVREVDKFLRLDLDFPDEMEHLAEYLSPDGLYEEQVRSTVLSRGGGLQSELVDAVCVVETMTGRPHYRELADLVNAIAAKQTAEDDLRKTVANFRSSLFRSSRSRKQIQRLIDRGTSKWKALRESTETDTHS